MTTVEVKLTLPDPLAEEAAASGLLSAESFERLLRDEIRRRRAEGLFAAADRLNELSSPALTDEQVLAEIQSARAEKRAGHARGA